jgi:hypothetical protein
MAKPLVKPQPRSSVAGMLERGVGAQALVKPPERISTILPTPIAEQGQTSNIERSPQAVLREIEIIPRQFTLRANSDRVLKDVVSVYSSATGLDLKHSEFLRSVLIAVEHAMPEITREAKLIGRLKRPKNDRGTEEIREQMERIIAKAFVAAMRAAGTLD